MGLVLVVVIVAVIFGAGKLPDLQKKQKKKLKLGLAALEKGKEELNKNLPRKLKKPKIILKMTPLRMIKRLMANKKSALKIQAVT